MTRQISPGGSHRFWGTIVSRKSEIDASRFMSRTDQAPKWVPVFRADPVLAPSAASRPPADQAAWRAAHSLPVTASDTARPSIPYNAAAAGIILSPGSALRYRPCFCKSASGCFRGEMSNSLGLWPGGFQRESSGALKSSWQAIFRPTVTIVSF